MGEVNYKNNALTTYYSRLIKKGMMTIDDVQDDLKAEVQEKVNKLPDLRIDAEKAENKIDTEES